MACRGPSYCTKQHLKFYHIWSLITTFVCQSSERLHFKVNNTAAAPKLGSRTTIAVKCTATTLKHGSRTNIAVKCTATAPNHGAQSTIALKSTVTAPKYGSQNPGCRISRLAVTCNYPFLTHFYCFHVFSVPGSATYAHPPSAPHP
jgi:hypothetical protein